MEFRCILEAQNIPDRYFAVSWAFNSSLIAWGPAPCQSSTVVALREARGELQVVKEATQCLRAEDLPPPGRQRQIQLWYDGEEKAVTGEFIDKESKRPELAPSLPPHPVKAIGRDSFLPHSHGLVTEASTHPGSLGRREELWGGAGQVPACWQREALLSPAHALLPHSTLPPCPSDRQGHQGCVFAGCEGPGRIQSAAAL